MSDSELVPMVWRTPAGEAIAVPFATPDEVIAAAVAAAMAAFDMQAGDDAARRVTALARCLQGTPDAGPPLARALRRWRLDDGAARLVLLLVASELSPAVLALARAHASDAARPGVTVEAAARLFGGDARGVAAIARALAPGQPLANLALVALRGADVPLPWRSLAVAPRVIDIALGASELDLTTGAHAAVATGAGAAPAGAAAERVRGVLGAVGRAPIGLVRGGRDALPALARLVEDGGRALLAVELSLLADEPRMRAIARDAAFLGAAVAAVVDVAPHELARAARAVDRLAAHAPVFVIGGAGEPAPAFAAGAIEIEIPAPTAPQLHTAVATAFAGVLDATELDEVAATVPRDLGAIGRAAAAVRALELPPPRVTAARRVVAEQLAVLDGGLARLATDLPALPAALDASIEDVVRRWRAASPPRRLRVLIAGRLGIGKTTAAAHLAVRVGAPAFAVDVPRLLRGPDRDPPLAAAIAAAEAGGAVLVIENVDLLGARRPGRSSGEPSFPVPWLTQRGGLVAITTSDAMSGIEPQIKRDLDAVISVAFPGEPERATMWAWHAGRRGWQLDAAMLAALAKIPLGPAQIERVASYARPEHLVAAAEQRAMLIVGRIGAEVD